MDARVAALTAAFLLAFAGVTSAATSGWMTERAALASAKTRGVQFPHRVAKPIDGFCKGVGAHHGAAPTPAFRRFDCTLVFPTGAGTAWYELLLQAGGPRLRVLKILMRA